MANVTVVLTQTQFNWLQNVVNAQVLAESTASPFCSGDLTDNPTFLQNNLILAQGSLAALRSGVIL